MPPGQLASSLERLFLLLFSLLCLIFKSLPLSTGVSPRSFCRFRVSVSQTALLAFDPKDFAYLSDCSRWHLITGL